MQRMQSKQQNIKISKNHRKNKYLSTQNKINDRKSKKSKMSKKRGGGFISSFVFNPDAGTNMQKPVQQQQTGLMSLVSKLNPETYSSLSKRQSIAPQFVVYFNYNKPSMIQIKPNIPNKILSSVIETEPHIIIGNMNRYIITITNESENKLLWVAEFNYNTKIKTILSYKKVIPPFGITYLCKIKIYTCPQNIPSYTVIDMSTEKRRKEYKKFTEYLNNNTSIVLFKEYILNVSLDSKQTFNLFNKINTIKPEKLKTEIIPSKIIK